MEYFELPPSYQKRIHADMSDDEITTIEIELYNLAIISRYDFTFDNERTKWARIYNNEIFRSALGDFLAIAKGNKTINYHKKNVKKSHHAGYTDDEIYVPLIVVKR